MRWKENMRKGERKTGEGGEKRKIEEKRKGKRGGQGKSVHFLILPIWPLILATFSTYVVISVPQNNSAKPNIIAELFD